MKCSLNVILNISKLLDEDSDDNCHILKLIRLRASNLSQMSISVTAMLNHETCISKKKSWRMMNEALKPYSDGPSAGFAII